MNFYLIFDIWYYYSSYTGLTFQTWLIDEMSRNVMLERKPGTFSRQKCGPNKPTFGVEMALFSMTCCRVTAQLSDCLLFKKPKHLTITKQIATRKENWNRIRRVKRVYWETICKEELELHLETEARRKVIERQQSKHW